MKAKKYMIVGIIVLLISLVGSIGTYAWFTWSSTNNTSLTMSIGELADVSFSSGNDISTNALAPVFNYTDGEKTTFIIRNKSDSELKYKVLLNITSIEDELKSSSLKYKLLSGNNVVIEGDFSNITSNSSITLYESTLTKGNISFTFYLYIDGNEENDLNMMGKNITGNIMVEAKEKTTFAEYITKLYTDTSKTEVTNNETTPITYNYATSVNLMNDRLGSMSTGIDSGNIRYYGASPNNYIYFNCDDYSNQTSSTCELWRIIGVFDGKVKIMRNENIGIMAYDNDNEDTYLQSIANNSNSNEASLVTPLIYDEYGENTVMQFIAGSFSNGQNDYSKSSLQKILNNYYYNGLIYNGASTYDFTSTGLKNDTTRNMISETTYYTRGYDSDSLYVDEMYDKERVSGIVNSSNATIWTGKIAVPYPSDYGYAADFGQCTKKLDNYNDSICKANNWMFNIVTNKGIDNGSLVTPHSGDMGDAWCVIRYGGVFFSNPTGRGVSGPLLIVPVLSLNSELIIETGETGTGTSNDPYQLSGI